MRYRRLSYRYAVVLATGGRPAAGGPRPLGEGWRSGRFVVELAQTVWRPPADVYETADRVTVTLELAGVDHEQLDVLLFEDALIVEGQRRLRQADANGVYHAAEIRQGPFRLELPLPGTIDTDRVEAHYERGLLQMTFPKQNGEARDDV